MIASNHELPDGMNCAAARGNLYHIATEGYIALRSNRSAREEQQMNAYEIQKKAAAFQKSINQYMQSRTPLDVTAVYEILKDRFPLTLTHAFALENGEADYAEDFVMVCGTSAAGAFRLYDDGLYGVFDAEKADGSYTHWHPTYVAEAVEDVIAFMQGDCRE